MGKPTRKEVEKVVRKILASRSGEKFAPNLFRDTVNQIMKEYEDAKPHEEREREPRTNPNRRKARHLIKGRNDVNETQFKYATVENEGCLMVCICKQQCAESINLNELQNKFNSKLLLHIRDKNGKIIPLNNYTNQYDGDDSEEHF